MSDHCAENQYHTAFINIKNRWSKILVYIYESVGATYSRVAYIYVRSRAKYLKFRTTTSKINTLRKLLMQQKYYFVHEM